MCTSEYRYACFYTTPLSIFKQYILFSLPPSLPRTFFTPFPSSLPSLSSHLAAICCVCKHLFTDYVPWLILLGVVTCMNLGKASMFLSVMLLSVMLLSVGISCETSTC